MAPENRGPLEKEIPDLETIILGSMLFFFGGVYMYAWYIITSIPMPLRGISQGHCEVVEWPNWRVHGESVTGPKGWGKCWKIL